MSEWPHGPDNCTIPDCPHCGGPRREQLIDIMKDAAKGETKASLRSEIDRLQRENAELREALRPFVQYTPDHCFNGNGRYKLSETKEPGGGWFGSEDFRRARAALRALDQKEAGK